MNVKQLRDLLSLFDDAATVRVGINEEETGWSEYDIALLDVGEPLIVKVHQVEGALWEVGGADVTHLLD